MKILKKNGTVFTPHEYVDEPELQDYVENNLEYIFGKDAIWVKGGMIGGPKGSKGVKGKPDLFVIQIERENWVIVEVELERHPVYAHISDQINRFASAWHKDPKRVVDYIYDKCKASKKITDKFLSYGILDIHKFISDLIDKNPDLVIIIDEYTEELKDLTGIWKFDLSWSILKAYENSSGSLKEMIHEIEPLYSTTFAGKIPIGTKVKTAVPTRKLVFLGKTIPFKHSKEIPVIVSNELISLGKLTKSKIPWGPGKHRYLINDTQIHPSGKNFRQPMLLSNGWWVETASNEEYQLRASRRLIEHCGEKDSDVRIEPL